MSRRTRRSRHTVGIAAALVATTVLTTGLTGGVASAGTEHSSGQSRPYSTASGTVLRVKVASTALSGNLEGADPQRDVSIYLPPGYDKNRSTR